MSAAWKNAIRQVTGRALRRGSGVARSLPVLLSVAIGGDLSLQTVSPAEACTFGPPDPTASTAETASCHSVRPDEAYGAGFEVTDLQANDGVLAEATPPAGEIVTKELDGRVFHIPKGYIDPFNGYAGYVSIHALLPDFGPETPANTKEFHTDTFGNIVSATLSHWTSDNLTGKKLLELYIDNSLPKDEPHSTSRGVGDLGVPFGNNFVVYKDLLFYEDIFVRKDSDYLLMIACKRYTEVPFPDCYVRERMWGTLLLEYRYSRSFIDDDIENSIKINAGLHRLLGSFLSETMK